MTQSRTISGITLRAQRATAPRVATAVTLTSASHFFLEHDGTVHGIFVATPQDFTRGQEILVEVGLHSYVLLLRGRVLWRRDGDDETPAGVGVAFGDLTVPARMVIESFSARRPPARYATESRSACG